MQSTRQLEAVEVSQRGDGMNDAYLRRNITSEEVETDGAVQTVWSADELHFVTRMTAHEIEEDFDGLWQEIEREQMTDEERVAALTSELLDTQEALADMYVAIIGGDE